MRKAPYLRYVSLILVLGLLLAALGWAVSFDATPLNPNRPHNPREEVQAAWKRVRQAGSYHFAADVTQHTIPMPTVTNVGRRSRQDALRLEGQTDLHEQEMQLMLWSQGGSVLNAADGVQVRVEGDRAFARRGDGAWEEVDDFTGAFAPAGDFLAFLAAARDISRAGQETRAGISFTRYTFGVDGPRFAAYARDQLQQHLAQQGELPPGVTLDLPRAYVGTTGTGELWIGPDGLPLRQRLELQFPEQDDQRIEAQVTVDFSQFGPITAQAGPVWWGALLSPRQLGQAVLLVVPMLAFSLLLVVHRRSRTVYTALVLAVIASMVVTPLLQSLQLAAFSGRLAARAQAQEERQRESQAQEALREAALGDPFDPHADPLVMANTHTGSSPANVFPPLGFAAQQTMLTTATCDLSGSQLTPDNPTDTDADGLTDYQECILGTDALYFDTDGDTITDTLEVGGFDLNQKHWSSDPLSLDSNSDGIGDIVEWWAAEVDNMPGDTDGDGTPDLFDDDNDDDGVRDSLDLSPFEATAREFTRESPLSLVVDGLQPNQPTFVEFQVRPTDPNHLWYAFNVLDWPQGDNEGQMQDTDGATFAQVTGATDAASQNGDVKLVPMLEIQITGEPDNLPVTATRTITDIYGQVVTRTVYPELDNYGIFVQTVQEAPPTVKAAYVPLHLTTDPQSGARVAFYGKMLYRPTAEWGNAQQVRLVWAVQALVDHACVQRDAQKECTQYADNQLQVIHTYYDDWFLAGLNVTEDHGSDIAIFYEDPALDDDLNNDNGLLGLVSVLDTTFLVGADCSPTPDGERSCLPGDGDGQRDYVIARPDPASSSRELGEVFDYTQNGAGDAIEPWGLPNRLRVSSASYDDRDEALMTTVMTETVGILNTAFDLSQPVTPTLLFAREERARSLNLDEQGVVTGSVAWQDAELTLHMNASPAPGGRPVETLVGVSWAPYRRDASGAWEAMPLEDYFDEMARRVSATQDPQSAQALTTLLVLNADYLALHNGLVNTVQLGNQLTLAGGPDDGSDEDLEEALARMYAAPGGQGVEAASSFLVGFIYPNIPVEEQIRQIFLKRGQPRGNIPTKYLSKYLYPTRLEMWSAAAGSIALVAGLANLEIIMLRLSGEDTPALAIANSALSLTVNTANLITTSLSVRMSFMVKAVEVGHKAARASVLRSGVTRACKIGATIGLLVAVGVTWGFFIYAVTSGDVDPDSPAFRTLVFGAIAATVVAICLFAISLNPVGAFIVAVICVIDAFIMLICAAVGEDDCFTITGGLTKAFAEYLHFRAGYSADWQETVELKDSTLGPLDAKLKHTELGLQAGNGLIFSSRVTTTIRHKYPTSSFYKDFKWEVPTFWTKDKLTSTRFNYAFNDEPSYDDTKWQTVPWEYYPHGGLNFWMYEGTAMQEAVGQADLAAGINFRPVVQLVTRYDYPGVLCEKIKPMCFEGFCGPPVRECRELRVPESPDTVASDDISEKDFAFDVFPADLTTFYAWNWGFWTQSVPDFRRPGSSFFRYGGMWFEPQRDRDGDGLLSFDFGGNDPNDHEWDTDGDGLSDARELELRFQGVNTFLGNRDSDGDGLDDSLEVRLGTDPGRWDSDGDGLSDKEEVDGWDFTYGQDVVRATSDPLAADTDGDGMSDAAERDLHDLDRARFPYHPRVFNVQPIALRTSLSGQQMVFDSGQAYARPGATLVHTATVRNNVSAAIYAQGALTVSVPAELGGQIQNYPLDYFGGEERSISTHVSVPTDATFQEALITSSVSAQLQPGQPQASSILRQLNEDLTGTYAGPGHIMAIAPAPSQWGAPHVVAGTYPLTSGECSIRLYRAGGDSLIGPPVQLAQDPQCATVSHLGVACADNGHCLVIWRKWGIYGALAAPDGALGSPFLISKPPPLGSEARSAAVATDGKEFLVVWIEPGASPLPALYSCLVTSAGGLGSQWTVTQGPLEYQPNVDVAYAGDDQYIVVWSEEESGTPIPPPEPKTVEESEPSGWLVRFMQAFVTTSGGPGSSTVIVTVPAPPGNRDPDAVVEMQVAYDSSKRQGGMLIYYVLFSGDSPTWFRLRSLPPASTPSCEQNLWGPNLRPGQTHPDIAFDPASQSWIETHVTFLPEGGDDQQADGLSWIETHVASWEEGYMPVTVVLPYASDCFLRAPQVIYKDRYEPRLACGAHECAFVSKSGSQPHWTFLHRFDLLENSPAQGALDQSKEDKIQIDNDAPTAAFDTDTYTLAAQNEASTFTLGGTTSDPSSGIGRVEVSVDNGSTWQLAAGLEAWTFPFEVPPGPRTYTLQVRAVDLLGHESPTASATVHVVSAPPGLDTGIQENALLPATFDEANGRWTLPLSGTATDMGGGLGTVEVQLDPNGSGWQSAVVDAAATPPTWSIDYPLANFDADGAVVTDPSGAYTFAVRAADQVGNMTPADNYLTRQVRVDATPPLARLTAIGGLDPRDVLVISQTVALSGVISDTGVLPTGVSGVEVSFTDIQPVTPTLAFQPADLGSPEALETTWSFDVPELEGFYQIDARGTDLAGNRNDNQSTWGQWRGEVDTQAPQVTLSAEHRGAGSTARTRYELVATDLNLNETTLDFPPCAGRGRVKRSYYDSQWYQDHGGDPTRLYELTHTCTRPGHQAEAVVVTACDVHDHCTQDTWQPPPVVPLATTGLGQPTLAFTPTGTIYLPLISKGESAGALPLSGTERGPGGEISVTSIDLDAYIFEPEEGSVFIAPGAIPVSGGAYAVNNLGSLTVTADGATIYTQTWPTSPPVQDSTWSTTWTPASAGQHVLTAVVEDWAGNTLADPEPIRIVVALDDQPPEITISDTSINRQDLVASNRADLTGTASSNVGVASVEVSVDGGPWRPTVLEATGFDTAAWLFPWALELPANPSYTVTARVTDAAGRTAEVAETIVVDITPPDPVDITLSYVDTDGASQPLARGQTVRDAQSLVIAWTASADDSGLSGYHVGWTTSETPDPAALTAYATSDQAHTQAVGEAQALYAHVGIEDTAGNWTWQMEGPVYVDAPHTPDLAADLAYHGWMESGCALIGVDREVSRTAPFAAALDAVQRLYATWSDEALRLTWTGANWDMDGDLFVYLDTTGGGATTAFSPYSPAEPTIGLPPEMGADYVLWVEDGGTASLRRWTGGAWAEVPEWTADLYLSLDTRLSEPHTDVLLPLDLLGSPTSLRLVALASEEEALHLWAAMPDENPRNSPRVISALAADLDVSRFDLTQDYAWPALGSGQCPSEGQFTDSDLRLTLNTNPTGIVVNYLSDDWLVLAPGARLDTNLLPADVAPAPLGTGDVIQYTLTYANNGTQPATDVRVRLTPFDALQLTNGNVLSLGDIPAGETDSVEFTAQVTAGSDRAAELDAIVSDAAHGDFDWLWSLHPVDRDPPTGVAIHTPRGYVRSGQATVGGVAEDASGLRQVTLSVSGTEQPPCPDSTPRDGAWTCDWEVPAAVPDGQTFQLEVTATDLHGNTSAPASAVVRLDNTPPEVVSLDEVVRQALADGVLVPGEFVLSGQVQDNFQAAGVRLCFERAEGGHCTEVAAQPGDTSAGAWTYALYPLAADGISETLSIYGRDGAGNLSSAPLTREYELDNVGPQVEVTLQRDTIGLGSSQPVMAGTVQDANGVAKMFASLRTPEGEMLWPEVELTGEGDGWSMIMRPPNAPETLGPHTIRLYAQDGFGNQAGYGPFEVEVVEANAIPEVEAGPDQTTDEGSLVSLAPATFHDENAQDTHTATINWGDGTEDIGVISKTLSGTLLIQPPVMPFTPTVTIYLPTMFKGASDTIPPPAPSPPGSDGTVSGSHVYADNGVYTVKVCVTDSMGDTGCDTLVVTVDNVAPTVDAGPDQSADEGSAVNLAAAFNDKGTLDTHTATINWGDGAPAEAGVVSEAPFGPPGSTAGADGTVSGTHVYADNGVYTVEVCLTDDDGDTGCDTLVVTVDNVAPTVDAGPDQTVYRNDAVTVSGTWTDPAGSLDNPYSWWWDLDGDGKADSSGTATYGDTIVETTSFALEGFYTLTFEVTDKDGGSGGDSLVIEVLNRPPDCSEANPSIDIIWPADHKFVPVNVLGVTDPEQDEIAITIESIYQDEPVDTYGDGSFTPDGQGVGTDTAEVRAERAGTKKVPGNGRVYHIGFSADDGHGGSCSGEVLVGVPHNKKDTPVDEGALYDSTALAP